MKKYVPFRDKKKIIKIDRRLLITLVNIAETATKAVGWCCAIHPQGLREIEALKTELGILKRQRAEDEEDQIDILLSN